MTEEKTDLKRGLSFFDCTAIVMRSMIGSGIFIVSAAISRTLGSPGWLLVSWLFAGLITIMAALSYSELASMYPQAGGQYIYLREACGKLPAFLYGWTLFCIIQTGTIAAVCVGFAKFTGVIFPCISSSHWICNIGVLPGMRLLGKYDIGLNTENLLAIIIIIFLTWINTCGLTFGKLVQNVFTTTKVVALIGLILLGFLIGRNMNAISTNFQNIWDSSFTLAGAVHELPLLGVAMVGSLFSCDAWNNITFTAGEVINPKKNIPLSLAFGTGAVILLYVLVNVVYLCVLPMHGSINGSDIFSRGIQFAKDDRVGTAVMQMIFGDYGSVLMAMLIMVSTFGCANGIILSGARVYYAMAKDNLFFKIAGTTNSRAVPQAALIMQGIWTSLLCISGTYSDLLDYVIFAVLLFYILTIAGLFILRKTKPDIERPYKAFGYPIIPALYIFFALAISIDLLIYKPLYTWPGLVIVLAGIPVYHLWQRKD